MDFRIRHLGSSAGLYLLKQVKAMENSLLTAPSGGVRRRVFDGYVLVCTKNPRGTVAKVVDPTSMLMAVNAVGADDDVTPTSGATDLAMRVGDRGSYTPGSLTTPAPAHPPLSLTVGTRRTPVLYAANTADDSKVFFFRAGALKQNGYYTTCPTLNLPRAATLTYVGFNGAVMSVLEASDPLVFVRSKVFGGDNQYTTVEDPATPFVPRPTVACALSVNIYQSELHLLHADYNFYHLHANKIHGDYVSSGAIFGAGSPVSGIPGSDGRFDGDGIPTLASYTDELFTVVPVLRQSMVLLPNGSEHWDWCGEWGLYLHLARMDRKKFVAGSPSTWMKRVSHAMFDTYDLPDGLKPARGTTYLDKFPVFAYNSLTKPMVSRYAGGYSVVFRRQAAIQVVDFDTQLMGTAEAIVVLQVASAGLVVRSTVLMHDMTDGRAGVGQVPAPFLDATFYTSTPVGSITVKDKALTLVWRQQFARAVIDPLSNVELTPEQATGEGNYVLVTVTATGVTSLDLGDAAGAWPLTVKWLYGKGDTYDGITEGITSTRDWADATFYASAMPGTNGDDKGVKDIIGQVGANKICWVAIDHGQMMAKHNETMTHRLIVCDLTTMALEVRGEVFSCPQARELETAKVTVVTAELVDSTGKVTRPAVLIASITPTLRAVRAGRVLLSTDGGKTWNPHVANLAGASGAFYAGNVMRPFKAGSGVSLQYATPPVAT